MKIRLVFFFQIVLCVKVMASTDYVIGYYPYWVKTEFPAAQVDVTSLTHVMHAFAYPTADGQIVHAADFLYPELNEQVHAKGRIILLSLGGWGNSDGFAPMAADSSSRKTFVTNVLTFCLGHNYDGVDLDWEHPSTPQDRENLILLVKELRQEFDKLMRPQRIYITMAVTASHWAGQWLNYDELQKYVDWFGCMTYDFHGSWTDHAGHNSPLYASGGDTDGSVDSGFHYLASTRKVPFDKILIGVPFYGRGFNASRLYGPSSGVGSEHSYTEIPALLQSGWTYHWDNVAQVPYITNPEHTKLISYDDTVSVRLKAEYAIQKKIKGLMIWALGQDYMEGQQPLLKAVAAPILNQTSVGHSPMDSSANFKLVSNYPNPFNNTTLISFLLPQPDHVSLGIFDLEGRRVAALFDGLVEAGDHTISFAADKLASGLYVCRLITRSQTYVHKMICIK